MAAPYVADLCEGSWLGAAGHEHARAHDPRSTAAFNERIKADEREKARRSAERLAAAKGGDRS